MMYEMPVMFPIVMIEYKIPVMFPNIIYQYQD